MSRTVMIVDDSLFMRKILRDILAEKVTEALESLGD